MRGNPAHLTGGKSLNRKSVVRAITVGRRSGIVSVMNASLLSWQDFRTKELRTIEIHRNELKLVYTNNAELGLEFADEDQLDRFVCHLVGSLVNRELSQEVMWN